ncbi:NnrS family protein [bacterium]|nr:NnrS family protein [bacterium]
MPIEARPQGSLAAWLGYGFRPFFSLGMAAAVLLVALWLTILGGSWVILPGLSPLHWHAHEMFFGFGAAIVAGFLLTAVPNWTGLPTPRGKALAGLVLVWLAGRVVSWWGGPPAVLDLLFLPALGVALGGPLLRAGQPQNLAFLPVLGMLWMADLLFWVGNLGGPGWTAPAGLSVALYGLLMLISMIGGRVIPFFAEKALAGLRPRRVRWLEIVCVISLPMCALVEAIPTIPVAVKAFWLSLCALLHLARMLGWWEVRVAKVPLLWVLYLGYFFLPLGLSLKGLAWVGYGSPSAATHALTAGCIGTMCLGMMARVSLGHTGRELKPARPTIVAFGLIGLAGLVRSLVPFLWPSHYVHAIWCAGGLWCLAFSLLLWVYFPLLIRPRPDGKVG